MIEYKFSSPVRNGVRCIQGFAWLIVMMLIQSCVGTPAAGVSIDPGFKAPIRLISVSDLSFEGAFALPDAGYAESSANWAEGTMEVVGSSLFFVGHQHDDAIAEFEIPSLRQSESIEQLAYAKPPKQSFAKVLEKVQGGNAEGLDQIVGLEYYKGRLIGNALEYYDGPADNKLTTFVIQDAAKIDNSSIAGFYSMRGQARAAGWLSQVPTEWQAGLGCTHISGHSSGGPIIGRHSVGPSAFCINLDNALPISSKRSLKTNELLGFALERPLQDDLFNESLQNNLWTHLSQARFGFIVPGTSTYATFGSSGGHNSGVGYKLQRQDGSECGGYCSVDPEDNYNYYWLWDMRDLLAVKQGRRSASSVGPYESGIFDVPFQTDPIVNRIGGASYDEQSGLLYISLLKANNTLGLNSNPPIIVAYKVL